MSRPAAITVMLMTSAIWVMFSIAVSVGNDK
jgi:hypothetical protein